MYYSDKVAKTKQSDQTAAMLLEFEINFLFFNIVLCFEFLLHLRVWELSYILWL